MVAGCEWWIPASVELERNLAVKQGVAYLQGGAPVR